MEINKQKIDDLINEFTQKKDSVQIKQENLIKFNKDNELDIEFLTYVNGIGGYYIKFLNFLVKNTRPKVIVELGNREALSTMSIFDAIQGYDGQFYTIDIEKDQRYCPDIMFTHKQVKFLFGDACSNEIIKQLPKNIDLLFSDTIHFNFQIEDEFEIYQHLLSDVALVAIDDINLNDKGEFFKKISYDKWDLTELCHKSGWGLFLFERKNKVDEITQNNNILKSIIKVWERKYNKVYTELNKPRIWKKIKNKIKSVNLIYKTYTISYNKIYKILNNISKKNEKN